MDDEAKRHGLRAGFDADAQAYDRTRPVCPAQLFDDLISLAGLAAGDLVAEIGCGTGQATVPLAERGLLVTAIELGAELAEVARRKLAAFPGSRVLTSSFEAWQPEAGEGGAFGAVRGVQLAALDRPPGAVFQAVRTAQAGRRDGRDRVRVGAGGRRRPVLG